MRAVVARAPGGPEVLVIEERPEPAPLDGWVTIRVKAFGLNRAELFTRQGHSPGVEFPRVLGIECVGEVMAAPGSDFEAGQRVVALMGGMGRDFDGSYAEVTQVPAAAVFAVNTTLDWAVLGALPEMFQTAHGSLTRGLELAAGDRLLIRGGTSSVGLLAMQLAKDVGAIVAATTRQTERIDFLREHGADFVIVEDGTMAPLVPEIWPGGADGVLELVGTKTLRDSLRCVRPGGVVCMTGILGGSWRLDGFEPLVDIPSAVRLTSYSGSSSDLDLAAFQRYLDRVAAGEVAPPLDRTFRLDEIAAAHELMEGNRATGKLVVLL